MGCRISLTAQERTPHAMTTATDTALPPAKSPLLLVAMASHGCTVPSHSSG